MQNRTKRTLHHLHSLRNLLFWGGLVVLVASGAPGCGSSAPVDEMQVGYLPRGANKALVSKLSDGCGLHPTDLVEGQMVSVVLDQRENGVGVAIPGTTLPRLFAAARDRDRFRTEVKEVPITAQDGRCSAIRRQYYEGAQVPPAEYQVTFLSQDGMPMGSCGVTPIPCTSTLVFSIPFCPSPSGCGPKS